MDIDRSAPVVAHARVQIAAEPELVWAILSDLEAWPRWRGAVKDLSLHGPVAPGTTFVWKAGPGRITSTLVEVDPVRAIAWTGRTMGIRAVDVFRLTPRDGGTAVAQDESWSGLAPRLFPTGLHRRLHADITAGLAELKAEAERRGKLRTTVRRAA
jgi:hypothetical protein